MLFLWIGGRYVLKRKNTEIYILGTLHIWGQDYREKNKKKMWSLYLVGLVSLIMYPAGSLKVLSILKIQNLSWHLYLQARNM